MYISYSCHILFFQDISNYSYKEVFFFEINQQIVISQSFTINYIYAFHLIKIGKLYLIALTISQKLRFVRIVED